MDDNFPPPLVDPSKKPRDMSEQEKKNFPSLDKAAEKTKAEEEGWEMPSKKERTPEAVMVSGKPEKLEKIPSKVGKSTPKHSKADWQGHEEWEEVEKPEETEVMTKEEWEEKTKNAAEKAKK